ncbi:MAG: tRNA preQ1(34) S-adenosylmethionine ribosyltransferase-isomerase QueA [Desulfobacteraceae bacterium 4572_130]|nr:MAG: tRNA preQ1(34) S-adenosylmethionine ribosyltransferase-isomerase QueA [Desulfobacteraceae bacterium 4572_130]
MYLLSDYKFHLPENQIAQKPAKKRDDSKLLRMDKKSGKISHHQFCDIEKFLKSGDVVIINNTKVIPARLKGKKETGGKIEVLIINYFKGLEYLEKKGCFQCNCLIKASKSPKKGAILFFNNNLKARVEDINKQFFNIKFFHKGNFNDIINQIGTIPLPPYIKRDNFRTYNDKENYQTVYASKKGAIAAPTAGLHFTQPLIEKLEKNGIEFVSITLHVGYGTFVPVRVDDIRKHRMHSEFFSISAFASEKINKAKKQGRRIIAVGTTSMRTIEYVADNSGGVTQRQGMCNLFIYPDYKFKCVDAIITNFHLPKSTLLMLVSAFAGRQNILSAYKEAVKKEYRFFSYGDAMFIE